MNSTNVDLPGGLNFSMECHTEEDYITSCIQTFHNWEPNVSLKIIDILTSASEKNINGCFIDIGACYGYYSIIAGKMGFLTFSYEPNPENFNYLKKNIEENKLNNVETFNIGIGEDNPTTKMARVKKNLGASNVISTPINEDFFEVNIKPLDHLGLRNKILIVKIDVEGHEPSVIKNSLETIKENEADFIFIEISPKFLDVQSIVTEIFKPMWALDYFSFDIGLQDSGEISNAIKQFTEYSNEQDLEKALNQIEQTNFLFIKKQKKDDDHSTNSNWKDGLIIKWKSDFINELYFQNQSLHKEILEKSKQVSIQLEENKRLFTLLESAGDYQKLLLNIIKEKDATINSFLTS